MDSVASKSTLSKECSEDSDCGISQACLPGVKTRRGSRMICKERRACRDRDVCPVPLDKWTWTSDISVVPLKKDEAKAVGGRNTQEDVGVGFELVSPVLSGEAGMHSAQEILALLRHVGIQSGPSQGLHVHVNAVGKAPGSRLSYRGIGNVWVAWAKYQLVLDEFLSPSRLEEDGSYYSRRLFLGQCRGEQSFAPEASCADNPCPCVRSIFTQMHEAVNAMEGNASLTKKNILAFCNAVISRPGMDAPCSESYPHSRYFQLNLAALARYGTIEFRAHSATYDGERIARWVKFVVAFVEYFGTAKEGSNSMATFFDEDFDRDLAELTAAQRNAKTEELFQELAGVLDPETKDFYIHRKWEKKDKLCKPPTMGAYAVHTISDYDDGKANGMSEADRFIQTAADIPLSITNEGEEPELESDAGAR